MAPPPAHMENAFFQSPYSTIVSSVAVRQLLAASVKPCRLPRADIRRLHRGEVCGVLMVPGADACATSRGHRLRADS